MPSLYICTYYTVNRRLNIDYGRMEWTQIVRFKQNLERRGKLNFIQSILTASLDFICNSSTHSALDAKARRSSAHATSSGKALSQSNKMVKYLKKAFNVNFWPPYIHKYICTCTSLNTCGHAWKCVCMQVSLEPVSQRNTVDKS